MWPNSFDVIRKLSENLHQFLLLNTIKNQAGGGSFSELKGINAGPPSCLYRGLRRLARDGCLIAQRDPADGEGGRPQIRFTLTDAGHQRLQELQNSLQAIFEEIQTRFLVTDQISVHDLLEKGTLQSLGGPVNHILHDPHSTVQSKRKTLVRMERMLQEQLTEVRRGLQHLEETGGLPKKSPFEQGRSKASSAYEMKEANE